MSCHQRLGGCAKDHGAPRIQRAKTLQQTLRSGDAEHAGHFPTRERKPHVAPPGRNDHMLAA